MEAMVVLGRAIGMLAELSRGRRVFLVGGAIRDVAMGRNPSDYDFAVSGSGLEFAQELARRLRTKLIVLSREDDEARLVWHGLTLDINGFGERTILDDLARRDFTVNALACELVEGKPTGDILDPARGMEDIRALRIRPVSERSLALDPLRLLRAYRLGLELGMEVEPAVEEQGRRVSLDRTAAERVGGEMLRIMEAPGSIRAIQRLQDSAKLAEILPDLAPLLADERLREHSLATYGKLEEMVSGVRRPEYGATTTGLSPDSRSESRSPAPGESFFSRYEPEWRAYFEHWGASSRNAECRTQSAADAGQGMEKEEPEETGLPYRRAMLKLCGLLHDIAKPQTRFVNSDGEVHFYGHDTLGSRVAGRMVRERLRLSRAQVKMVETHVQEHMRLHLLATNSDLTDRAIRRFFRDLGQEAFGLMMLCYADGWATARHTSHLEDTIDRMIRQKRAEDAKLRIQRYVTGHDLIALGLSPGPAFKVILQELEDMQLEGRINSHEEGIEYLKLNLPGLAAKADEQKAGD